MSLKEMIADIKDRLRSLFQKKAPDTTIIVININGKTDVTIHK